MLGEGCFTTCHCPTSGFVQTECPREAGAAHSTLQDQWAHEYSPFRHSSGRAGTAPDILHTWVELDTRLWGQRARISQSAMLVYNGAGDAACYPSRLWFLESKHSPRSASYRYKLRMTALPS